MKLALRQIKPLLGEMRALDGLVENNELKPFVFSSKVTWNKVKNIDILERWDRKIEKARIDRSVQAAGGRDKLMSQEIAQSLNLDWADHLDTEEEIPGLLTFSEDDLGVYDKSTNPGGNRIPSSVLATLLPFIVLKSDQPPTSP